MQTNILKIHLNLICLFCFLFSFSRVALAQGIIDDLNTQGFVGDSAEVFSETIQIISRSGKVFILSNANQLLNKGDFITMALKNNGGAVARAVVGKVSEGKAGIKILKVYSITNWGFLKKNLDVDIIRGDDSYLFKPKKKETTQADNPSIDSEEDLFNDTALLEENLNDFYQDNRHIKPDNIISAGYSQFSFTSDVEEGSTDKFVETQWNFAWAYQFSDNIWVEGLYGRTLVNGFPDESYQTQINNFTARLKYTFKAPLYSFVMPYIGFQTYSVSSPAAGQPEDNTTASLERAEREQDVIDKLTTSNIAIGATVLRRLVPGWFLKADLGTDIVSVGFAIEF